MQINNGPIAMANMTQATRAIRSLGTLHVEKIEVKKMFGKYRRGVTACISRINKDFFVNQIRSHTSLGVLTILTLLCLLYLFGASPLCITVPNAVYRCKECWNTSSAST